MSPSTIPLIVVALLMMIGDGSEVDRAVLLLGGTHVIHGLEEAAVIAGGETRLTSADTASVYVVGGDVEIGTDSSIDVVTHLGGSMVIEAGATIAELRAFGGDLVVEHEAVVERRVSLEGGGESPGGGSSAIATVVVVIATASLGAALEHRRPRQLANVAHAGIRHPVVSLAVGTTVGLTGIALVVFMAFTLILIPISIVAIALGTGLLALGLVALGHQLGTRLDRMPSWVATGLGVSVVVILLWLLGAVPLIGDIAVLAVLTTGLGAGVISLLGFRRFEPPELPE